MLIGLKFLRFFKRIQPLTRSYQVYYFLGIYFSSFSFLHCIQMHFHYRNSHYYRYLPFYSHEWASAIKYIEIKSQKLQLVPLLRNIAMALSYFQCNRIKLDEMTTWTTPAQPIQVLRVDNETLWIALSSALASSQWSITMVLTNYLTVISFY